MVNVEGGHHQELASELNKIGINDLSLVAEAIPGRLLVSWQESIVEKCMPSLGESTHTVPVLNRKVKEVVPEV